MDWVVWTESENLVVVVVVEEEEEEEEEEDCIRKMNKERLQ